MKNDRIARNTARKAQADRIAKAQQDVRDIVEWGKCPLCGSKLRRNQALAGWYQCEQFGADGFRKDSSKPACSWQGFTE